jgi:hypothetical protein
MLWKQLIIFARKHRAAVISPANTVPPTAMPAISPADKEREEGFGLSVGSGSAVALNLFEVEKFAVLAVDADGENAAVVLIELLSENVFVGAAEKEADVVNSAEAELVGLGVAVAVAVGVKVGTVENVGDGVAEVAEVEEAEVGLGVLVGAGGSVGSAKEKPVNIVKAKMADIVFFIVCCSLFFLIYASGTSMS